MSDPESISCPPETDLECAITSGALSDAMRAHLDSCESCRRRERDVRENLRFLAEMGPLLKREDAKPADRGNAWLEMPGYRIVREIARGGQGTVFEGLQVETRRRVAIKVIETGTSSPNALKRLEREAAIAAALRHPSIVTIYDSTPLPDGRHALAMEYVEGETLDEWAKRIDEGAGAETASAREGVRTKLRAMIEVCDAVQYAHLHGVIHRDLKPANVIIGEGWLPRVVDFGIARRLAKGDSITRPGAFAGTLAYASPEQVSGGAEGVDIRSDVYSLGVMLYEVLTGRRPYETDGSLTGAIANITTRTPEPLRTLSPGELPAGTELEAIVGKALSKERAERYQTAGALKEDLQNWIAGRAVEARRHSTLYVLRKTASRHRAAFVVAGAILVVLAVFAAMMAWSARRLDKQRGLLADSLAVSNTERGRLLGMSGSSARAEELIWPALARSGADVRDAKLGFASNPEVTQGAWALFELYSRHPALSRMSIGVAASGMRFENEDAVAVVGWDLSERLLTLSSGSQRIVRAPRLDRYFALTRPDVELRYAVSCGESGFRVDDLTNGGTRKIEELAGAVRAAVRGDGKRVVIVDGAGKASLWQLDPPRVIANFGEGFNAQAHATFTRDGAGVLFGLGSSAVMLRSDDGMEIARWTVPAALWAKLGRGSIGLATMSDDGKLLAVSANDRVLVFAGDRPGSEPLWTGAHSGFVNGLAFSADSRVLVSSGHERAYRTWDAATGEALCVAEQGALTRCQPAISRDGSRIAACDQDGLFQVWESRPRGWLSRLPCGENTVNCVRISPDGTMIAAANADGNVRVWRRDERSLVWSATPTGEAYTALAFSPDGRAIATATQSGTISTMRASDGGELKALFDGPTRTTWMSYTPDGTRVLAAGSAASIDVRDAQRGDIVMRLDGHEQRVIDGAFTRDGSRLVTVGQDGVGIVWDMRTGKVLRRLRGHGLAVRAVAVSPDGTQVATGGDDWTIRLWEMRTGECTRIIRDVKQHVFGLAYHPDGNLLFSCCRDPAVQVWDIRTGRELAKLEGHEGIVLSMNLSTDGRTLATASMDHSVGVWDLTYYQAHVRGNAASWMQASREEGK
jgi:WD40 repeat protein